MSLKSRSLVASKKKKEILNKFKKQKYVGKYLIDQWICGKAWKPKTDKKPGDWASKRAIVTSQKKYGYNVIVDTTKKGWLWKHNLFILTFLYYSFEIHISGLDTQFSCLVHIPIFWTPRSTEKCPNVLKGSGGDLET